MKKAYTSTIKFFAGVKQELQKVTWPSKKTVLNHTLIVIVSSVIVMLIVSAVDLGLTTSFEFFLNLDKG
jgi:preprotein translocase subunit SecE